jgi:hypothetical protein
LEVATLGPSGAFAFEADGLVEVESTVGDGDAGEEVVSAAGAWRASRFERQLSN